MNTAKMRSRGSALVAVLVIVVIGVLLAAGIMARAVSRFEDSTLALKRSGSRAMAWSGVQAAMATVAAQREQLLSGADVTLTDAKSWEFADTDGPGVWKVTLLALDENGTLAVPEATLVNVNTASEAQLAKIPVLGSSGAAGVMGRRARGPILAVEQVVAAAQKAGTESMVAAAPVTPESNRAAGTGEVSETDGDLSVATSSGASGAEGASGAAEHGLWVTALSADATVMIRDGKSDRFRASELAAKEIPAEEEAAQQDRLGSGIGTARTWAKRPREEHTLANLVAEMQAAGLKVEEWGKVLDGVEVSEDLFVLGRIDINRASESILATLPGVTSEVASNLVRVRSTLDESGRRDLAWPVVSGAMDAKVFGGIVDLITTRTLQYRIRVQAGRSVRQDATGVDADEFGVAKSTEGPVTERCVFEAVIDVAGEKPRVAYLRDVTLLDSAAMMAEAMASADADSPSMDGLMPDEALSEDLTLDEMSSPAELPSELGENGLRTERMQQSGGLDLGGGLSRSNGLDMESGLESDSDSTSANTGADGGTESSQSASNSPGASGAAPSLRADPRLGRWNTSGVRASERPAVAGTRETGTKNSGVSDAKPTDANDGVKSGSGKDAGSPKKKTPAKKTPERKAGSK